MLAVLLLAPAVHARPDQFTPVVVSAFTSSTRIFEGTDERLHLVYELVVTNTSHGMPYARMKSLSANVRRKQVL